MRSCLPVLAFLAGVFRPVAALAIDPGVARGALHIGAEPVQLAHAYAYLQEVGRRPGELRIAIVDREVPQKSVAGDGLALEQLARESKVRGLLLRFDPGDTRRLLLTVLDRPADDGAPLPTTTAGALRNFLIANNRAGGELEVRMPAALSRVRFSAPLFRGP